jgi:hypothetical protein
VPPATIKRPLRREKEMISNIRLSRINYPGREKGVLVVVDGMPIEHKFSDEKEALEHILEHFFHVITEETNNGN